MKRALIVIAAIGWLLLLLWAVDAFAACWTNVIMGPGGHTVTCMTCCYGNICTTNCF